MHEHFSDSKETNSRKMPKHLSWIFGGIALIWSVYYIWTKICQVLREALPTTQDGWWIMKKFTTEDTESVSFTGMQLYWALLGAIWNDITGVLTFVNDSLVYVFTNLFMVLVAILCVAGGLFFFYKTNKSQDTIKPEKFKGTTNAKPNGDGPSKENKDIPKEKDDDYMNIWKKLGLENRHKRYRRLTAGMMFFAFLLSIPWEYVRLYQTMVAEKVTQMTTGIPPECVPEQMSMTESMKSWLRWQFTWSGDPCLQYHKAILVDPMWQVPPLMVITSALSHCLIYPVEIFFSTLGKSLRLFFSEIPAQYQPVMLVFFVLLFMLVLIMLFGYRIRCPLISIEPKKSSLTTYLHLRNRGKESGAVYGSLDSSVDTSLDCSITPSLETELYGKRDNQKK